MSTINSNFILKRIFVGVIVIIFCFGVGLGAPQTNAQTNSNNNAALLAQIETLLKLVNSLQAQVDAMNTGNTTINEGGFITKTINIGGRVQTIDILRVRSGANTSANLISNVPAFSGGIVKDGPNYGDGYTWWYITYDNGVTGWSAENWLRSQGNYNTALAKEAEKRKDAEVEWKEDEDSDEEQQDEIDDLMKQLEEFNERKGDSNETDWTEDQEKQDEIDDLMKQLDEVSETDSNTSISIKYKGIAEDAITVPITESVKLTYHYDTRPEKCEITRKYENDESKLWHDWSSNYGREVGWGGTGYGEFYVPTVGDGLLEEIDVSCEFTNTTKTDSLKVTVVSSDSIGEFTFLFNQKETRTSFGVTEAEAYTLCQQEISNSGGSGNDVAECYWNDELFKQTSSWKG